MSYTVPSDRDETALLRLTPEDSRTVINERMLLDLFGAEPGQRVPDATGVDAPFGPAEQIDAVVTRALQEYPVERRVDLEWRWNGIARAFMKWGHTDVFAALEVYPGPIGGRMVATLDGASVAGLVLQLERLDVAAAIEAFDARTLVRDQVSHWERWRAELHTLPQFMAATVALLLDAARGGEAVVFAYC